MQCVLRKMDHSGWREVSSRVRELQLRHVREAALGVLAWGKPVMGKPGWDLVSTQEARAEAEHREKACLIRTI